MDTYEKKYKEALEKIKNLIDKDHNDINVDDVLNIFPELVESEDEKISKEIIYFLSGNTLQFGEDIDKYKSWIAWLEKQGEPNPYSGTSFKYNGHTFGMCARDGGAEILMDGNLKAFISSDKSFVFPATPLLKAENFCISKVDGLLHDMTCNPPDKVEPKFKVGDWITNGDYTWKIVEVEPLDYVLQSQDGNIVDDTISHVDEQFHSFTIEDTKDGDILFAKGNYFKEYTFIYSGMTEDNVMSTYCGFDRVHNNFGTKLTRFGRMKDFEAVYPATKEQRDLLFQKMKEAGYEWNAEKKELKKIKQKSSWSEEDEINLEKAIWYVENPAPMVVKDSMLVEWLKSLKQRINV